MRSSPAGGNGLYVAREFRNAEYLTVYQGVVVGDEHDPATVQKLRALRANEGGRHVMVIGRKYVDGEHCVTGAQYINAPLGLRRDRQSGAVSKGAPDKGVSMAVAANVTYDKNARTGAIRALDKGRGVRAGEEIMMRYGRSYWDTQMQRSERGSTATLEQGAGTSDMRNDATDGTDGVARARPGGNIDADRAGVRVVKRGRNDAGRDGSGKTAGPQKAERTSEATAQAAGETRTTHTSTGHDARGIRRARDQLQQRTIPHRAAEPEQSIFPMTVPPSALDCSAPSGDVDGAPDCDEAHARMADSQPAAVNEASNVGNVTARREKRGRDSGCTTST